MDVPGGHRYPALAADGLAVGPAVVADVGVSFYGDRRHRDDPPFGAEQLTDEFQTGNGITEEFPQRDDEEVADGVAIERTGGREPVLEHLAPGDAPVRVGAQRGQGHPQIPRREHVEFLAKPPGGTAVIGNGDDRGDIGGDVPQRLQARGESVPAAEGDDLQWALVGTVHYSRPRSRWRVCTVSPVPRSRRAIASVIATERCLPPVQPTATVT